MSTEDSNKVDQGRRTALKAAGGIALATMLPAPRIHAAGGNTIKIGYVSPQTGPLAVFGASRTTSSLQGSPRRHRRRHRDRRHDFTP